VALMEAMALGVPVVSTPVSGVAELVQHEQTGLLAPARDAPALADAMARLMADADLRGRLACHARQLIESDYDLSKNVARLAALFWQVAAGWQGR
jgi:glycosyltransferase involved in cell wall biosynthesis